MKNIDRLIEKKAKELKEFDIPKSTYYDWRRRYRLEGSTKEKICKLSEDIFALIHGLMLVT